MDPKRGGELNASAQILRLEKEKRVSSKDVKMRKLRRKGLRLAGVREDEMGKILGVSSRRVSGDPNDWLTEEDIISIMSALSNRSEKAGYWPAGRHR
jgi:hypothetical protein